MLRGIKSVLAPSSSHSMPFASNKGRLWSLWGPEGRHWRARPCGSCGCEEPVAASCKQHRQEETGGADEPGEEEDVKDLGVPVKSISTWERGRRCLLPWGRE